MAAVEDTHDSLEAIRRVLSYLVSEREQLRCHGADGAELEANRRAIAAMQWRLGRAAGGEDAAPTDSAAAAT
jgi:hypothetical protein